MTPSRQRAFVWTASLIVAAVLIALVLLGYPVLREKWHVSRLGSESYLERKGACEALGRTGTASCVPALFERLVAEASTPPPPPPQGGFLQEVDHYGTPANIYWEALVDIGGAAMPHLLRELKSGDANRRPWAANVLGHIGANALARRLKELGEVVPNSDGEYELEPAPEAVRTVVGALTGAASNPNESSALEAIGGLGMLGPVGCQALCQVFEGASGPVREAAARALVGFVDLDPATLAVLEKAKLDPSVEVRSIVVLAHRGVFDALIDPGALRNATTAEGPVAGAAEVRALSPAETTRRAAAREAARDKLEEILAAQAQAGDAACRKSALLELADPGPQRATTVALVVAALKDPEAIVRGAAAPALASAKGAAQSVVMPALLDALSDPEGSVRGAAAEAVVSLGWWGMEAAAADLIPLLKDDEAGPIVRNALISWDITVVPTLAAALKALINPSAPEADEAVELVDGLGGWTAPEVPFLLATLSASKSSYMERVVTRVLVRLCKTDPLQVSRLVEALGDSKARGPVILALAELGPVARTAARALRALAQSGPPDEQAAAAGALEAVEPPPPAAE